VRTIRRSRMRVGVPTAVASASVALVCVLTCHPLVAAALILTAPANVVGPANVEVRLEPGEPAGPVAINDDGSLVATATTAAGVAEFGPLPLAPGPHRLQAVLSGDGGRSWSSTVASVYSWGEPNAPAVISPVAGKRCVSPVSVRVRAGASTATVTLSVNGVIIRSVGCEPGESVDLGSVRLAKGSNVLLITATSLSGATSTASRTVKRTEWPYDTCIVIDKSDYRLYWVKGQQLVASYPIAHGRHNWTPTHTWKVLAKYKTDPHSVYGPRKMRLFKRVGRPGHYRYVFTRYGIHGTNQPGLIGTQASHGCIRMYNRDVLKLWPQVRLGTYVVTRP
jgi:lipoprotein-anchoring transpeptidase ErfK/SrfK